MEVLTVLSRMELRGLGINLSALNELSDVIKREMSLLEKRAFYIAGKKFNFMSSSSVAQVRGEFFFLSKYYFSFLVLKYD